MNPVSQRGYLIPRRNGDLDTAGALGRSARHLRQRVLGSLSTVQATSDRCKQCPDDQSDRMRPETSKGVHSRPAPFTKG